MYFFIFMMLWPLANSEDVPNYKRQFNERSNSIIQELATDEKQKKQYRAFLELIQKRNEIYSFHRIDSTNADFVLVDEELDIRTHTYRFRERHFFLADSVNKDFPQSKLGLRFLQRNEYYEVDTEYGPNKSEWHHKYRKLSYLIYGGELFYLESVLDLFEDNRTIRKMPAHVYLAYENCTREPLGSWGDADEVRAYRVKVPFVRVRTLINKNEERLMQYFGVPAKCQPEIIFGP
ncbi:hypothetical protein [Pontibacter sp. G13]|uniref:hypothetical protein n=1 Tax=Pontibacter sp. G13 TaxID=3074898 RepID=UPI00288B9E65|nr:hypothetical protein [Pontibacter sp. G13]WNJ20346.1 hypothetical protein RJD25_07685 [Pontibacter sp. G13]